MTISVQQPSAAKRSTYIIPDMVTPCTLKVLGNPHYKLAAAESREWTNSFDIFTNRKRAEFVQWSNELLVSRTFPFAPYEEFRATCDFVNLLFVVDEVSDTQSGKHARITGDTFLNVMRDPTWDDGSKLARMTQEFRARILRTMKPRTWRRLLEHCTNYIECVIREAELREAGKILPLPAYIDLRRENSALRPCCCLAEYCLGFELPDELFKDEAFLKAYWAVVDMVCWSNDVYSYNLEQSKGQEGNNVVAVLMKDKGLNLQDAMNEAGKHFNELFKTYMTERGKVAKWGPEAELYVNSLGYWVSGSIAWSFETTRYLGPKHAEIKKTRTVELLPREGEGAAEEIKPGIIAVQA